jgi:hypothetical protein
MRHFQGFRAVNLDSLPRTVIFRCDSVVSMNTTEVEVLSIGALVSLLEFKHMPKGSESMVFVLSESLLVKQEAVKFH